MPNFNGKISGFAVGDDLEVYRTITNVPTGETVEVAWLTVKENLTDTDDVAFFKKEIGLVLDNSQGIVQDPGSSGTAILRFFLTAEDTAELGNPIRETKAYFYDIQVRIINGRIYTPETGKITGKSQVTFLNTNV